MASVRKQITIRQDQDEAISKLPGDFSHHLQIALDDYIEKMTPKAINSPSAKKCWDCGVAEGEAHKETCEADIK